MKTVFSILALSMLAVTASAADIQIKDAWARATPPKGMASAAYMKIENHSNAFDALVSVETKAAKRAEIHHTTMDDSGMMDMSEVDRVALDPKSYVVLEPGGFHVMLMGLTGPLQEGQDIALTLQFEKSGTQTVRVPVKPITYQGK